MILAVTHIVIPAAFRKKRINSGDLVKTAALLLTSWIPLVQASATPQRQRDDRGERQVFFS